MRTEESIHEVTERLSELLNEAIRQTFGAEGLPEDLCFILGLKFDGQNGCELVSNLDVCARGAALYEMFVAANSEHDEFHAEGDGAGREVSEFVPAESVPEEVRARAEAIAERFGADKVLYMETVDTGDLADLPGTSEVEVSTPAPEGTGEGRVTGPPVDEDGLVRMVEELGVGEDGKIGSHDLGDLDDDEEDLI